MLDRERLIEFHLQALALLDWSTPALHRDALDDLRNGEFLTTSQAAIIGEVTDQAIRDWNEHAASIGEPTAREADDADYQHAATVRVCRCELR
jgi:hypothetical protein